MRVVESSDLPAMVELDVDLVVHGDNADVLPRLPDGAFEVIYIDPPFNTGKRQEMSRIRTTHSDEGTRGGFGGRRYAVEAVSRIGYSDQQADFLSFLAPRLEQAHRVLSETGTLYFHIDYREAHYCKLLLDEIFGRDQFLNEIIWAYDYGARTTKRWPAKHDTILVYVKDIARYHFDSAEVDREPYMAPGLQSAERAAKGKLPTDVWWHTIVPTNGKERTGYPSQKPEGVVRRAIAASSRPGSWCLDFFAGSGTVGAVAAKLGRHYVHVDERDEAIRVMTERLTKPSQDELAV